MTRNSTRGRTESEKLQARMSRTGCVPLGGPKVTCVMVGARCSGGGLGVPGRRAHPVGGSDRLVEGRSDRVAPRRGRGRLLLDWRTVRRRSKLFSVACVQATMVAIAQSVEHRVVVAGAAGSSPVSHPAVLSRDIAERRCRDSGFFVPFRRTAPAGPALAGAGASGEQQDCAARDEGCCQHGRRDEAAANRACL